VIWDESGALQQAEIASGIAANLVLQGVPEGGLEEGDEDEAGVDEDFDLGAGGPLWKVGHVEVALPGLEQDLNAPPHAVDRRQDLGGPDIGGNVGDEYRPVLEGELGLVGPTSAIPILAEFATPLIGDFLPGNGAGTLMCLLLTTRSHERRLGIPDQGAESRATDEPVLLHQLAGSGGRGARHKEGRATRMGHRGQEHPHPS